MDLTEALVFECRPQSVIKIYKNCDKKATIIFHLCNILSKVWFESSDFKTRNMLLVLPSFVKSGLSVALGGIIGEVAVPRACTAPYKKVDGV